MILLVCGQKRTTCSNQRKNLGDRFISILPILPLCSEFGAFNGLLHCFLTLTWYPATKDRHGWHQWSLVYFSYLWLYLSFFIYQSYGPSCASARSLVRSTVFCIVFCASVVSSYQDRPRRTQTKDQRSLVPWPVVRVWSLLLNLLSLTAVRLKVGGQPSKTQMKLFFGMKHV